MRHAQRSCVCRGARARTCARLPPHPLCCPCHGLERQRLRVVQHRHQQPVLAKVHVGAAQHRRLARHHHLAGQGARRQRWQAAALARVNRRLSPPARLPPTCGTNGRYLETRRGASPVALSTTTSCALASVTEPQMAAAMASMRLNGLVVWSWRQRREARGARRVHAVRALLAGRGRRCCWCSHGGLTLPSHAPP